MGWQRLPQPSHVSTGVLKETPTMIGTRSVRDLAPLSTASLAKSARRDVPGEEIGPGLSEVLDDDSDLQRQHTDVPTSVR